MTYFISHSRQDKRAARRLAYELSRCGHSVWLDEKTIELGSDLEASVAAAIEQSSVFVLLASPNAMGAEWVRNEVELARASEPGGLRIVSVLADGVTPADLPADLGRKVMLSAELSPHEAAQRLSDLHGEAATCACAEVEHPVWLRLDAWGYVEHPLDQMAALERSLGSVHLLTPDFDNLVDELRAAARPDLTWFKGDKSGIEWKARTAKMPSRHLRIVAILEAMCRRWVDAPRITTDVAFLRAAADEATRYLMHQLFSALRLLHHFDQPGSLSQTELSAAMERPVEPFAGGLRGYLAWGSQGESQDCPPYVEQIDLLPMPRPALGVVLSGDLGQMVGHAIAATTWVQAIEIDNRVLPLEAPFPDAVDITIALA